MKNKTVQLIGRCVVVLAALLASCDPFLEDSLLPEKQVVFIETEYFILPGNSIVIDLKTIVKQSFTNATLKISENPARGELTQLDTLLLKYKPGASFTEGSDQFVFSVFSNGRNLKTETVTINMRTTTDEFPCAMYAVEDVAYIKPDSTVTIKILDNDRICGADKKDMYKSIYSEPQYGTATLTDDIISYTANAGYEGWDQFVYKISTTNDNLKTDGEAMTSFGLISILINDDTLIDDDTCSFVVNNDSFTFEVNSTTPTTFELDVLSNDVICSVDSHMFAVSIIQEPEQGTAWLIEGGKIGYEKTSAFHVNYEDYLVYSVCYKGKCKATGVRLAFNVDAQWSSQALNLYGFFTSIFFTDENTGYVGGGSGIFKTIDGGKNWNKLTLPQAITLPSTGNIFSSNLFELQFLDPDHGFAAYGEDVEDEGNGPLRSNGYLMETKDGGATWSLTQFDHAVTSVFFSSLTTGFISTSSTSYAFYSSDDRIYKTVDGGASWNLMAYYGNCQDAGGVYNICFKNSTTGFARTNPTLMQTTDSGETWNCIFPPNFVQGQFTGFPGLAVANNSVYVTIAKSTTPSDGGTILRSANGVDWDILGDCSSQNNSMEFSPSGDTGFIIGTEIKSGSCIPVVHFSHDNGTTWIKETFDEFQTPEPFFPGSGVCPLYDVAVPSNNVAYAVRGDGLILKYSKK